MWSFVSGFFQHHVSRFIHVAARVRISFFLLLYDIPSWGETTFCLFTHQLMGMWVVSSLGLL